MPLPTPPPLPATCDVPMLANWLYDVAVGDESDQNVPTETRQARAVRALLENRIVDALWMRDEFFDGFGDDGRPEYDVGKMDAEILRVLGAP